MALNRRFNGKPYTFEAEFHNQPRALAYAAKLRKQGYMARVTKADSMTWDVWVRIKPVERNRR